MEDRSATLRISSKINASIVFHMTVTAQRDRQQAHQAVWNRGLSSSVIPPSSVIPAKAGIHASAAASVERWIPASAGMTVCAERGASFDRHTGARRYPCIAQRDRGRMDTGFKPV
jgi:hypothetical protein